MNLIEHLFMQKAAELCENVRHGSPEERELANVEALDVLKKIEPKKVQGLVVMCIQECEPGPKGEPGFELISSMVGSPELITHLGSGASTLTRLYQLTQQHEALTKAGLLPENPLFEALMGSTAMQGGVVEGRYEVPDGVSKQ